MAWSFRTFLSKWKPTARFVAGCIFKVAGGAAASADPNNELLWKCLAAGGEQTAEHVFDTLSPEQKRQVDDRFALLEPFLQQQIHLIEEVEKLAVQQDGHLLSLQELETLIRNRLPANLQPALQQLSSDLDRQMQWLVALEQRLMRRLDALDKRPKSPFWLSIDNRDDIDWLKQVYETTRSWPPEQRRQLHLGRFAGLLHEAGLHPAASEVCASAIPLAAEPIDKAALLWKKMRADLEQQRLDDALAALQEAIACDPITAPFPARKYQPLRLLGAGGFGTALLCRNTFEDEDSPNVVVKCLHAASLERQPQEMFREASVLKRLHKAHPELFLNVHEANFVDDLHQQRPYIVMDYFAGVTLTQWLSDHPGDDSSDLKMPLPEFLAIALPIAQALHAAHQQPQPILHRDLKPDNVMVRHSAADGYEVRVIDFGLALRCEVVQESKTKKVYSRALQGAAAAGTAKYAPPEQMGELAYPLGPYSDVFAFGRTCCQMLFRVLEPRTRHWKTIPQALAEALEKCMEEHPKHRHANFAPLVAVLQALAGHNTNTTVDEVEVLEPAEELVVPKPQPKPKVSPPVVAKVIPPQPVQGYTIKDLGIVMRLIPAGRFQMGSPQNEPDRSDDEKQHWVNLTQAFYLAAHPVTRGQFRRFVQAMNYKTEAERGDGAYGWTGSEWKKDRKYNWLNPGFKQDDEHPVVCVSWNDAQEFCQWLKTVTGQTYLLPTEAQWEYACRGRAGSSGTSGKVEITTDPYHFGKTINDKQANFNRNIGGTTKVGSYPKNGFGLFDMHGNVWEWCRDWYAEYPEADRSENAVRDPEGPSSGSDRVIRGGGWCDRGRYCRSANRGGNAPENRDYDLGLRVSRVPSGS